MIDKGLIPLAQPDIHEQIAAAVAAAPHSIVGRCRVPANVLGTRKGTIRPMLRKQQEFPTGGEPGRPWIRMRARAFVEEAARRAPKPKLVLTGHLPKATKQDRGTLAAYKDRGPQRLCKKYIRRAA